MQENATQAQAVVRRRVVDTPTNLRATVAAWAQAGRLIDVGPVIRIDNDPRRIAVDVELFVTPTPPGQPTRTDVGTGRRADVGNSPYPPAPARATATDRRERHLREVAEKRAADHAAARSTRRTVALTVAVTVAVLALLAGLAWLAVVVITWVVAHILYIVGGLVALLVVLGLAASSGGGAHCPGPWHR